MIKFNRKIIFIIIGVVIIGLIVSQVVLKNGKPKFSLVEVTKGDILQTVSETGTVKIGEEIGLSFKNSGKIEKIYVKVGDKVFMGQNLAKVETASLGIQYEEAKANFSMAEAKLDKLIAGSSVEEIQLAETVLANSCKDAISYLNYANIKANDASLFINLIQRSYFINADTEGLKVRENKEKIEQAKNQIKSLLNDVQQNASNYEIIDRNIAIAKNNVETIIDSLMIIRDIFDSPIYRNAISSADKTSLDTQISNNNTSRTQLSSGEGAIQKAKDELTIEKASPRQEDINLYKAQVEQAQAEVDILENQIADSTLKSPTNGTIKAVNKKIGEIAQSTSQDAVISLLPDEPFEIEVNIYEEDIVKIEIGDSVEISLIAFPDQKFSGKVISIDPAEKLINEVVYYKVKVGFDGTARWCETGHDR